MQKGPTPVALIILFRAFYFVAYYNYVHVPKPCNNFISCTFIRFIYFSVQIGSGLILAMWTRAICNSLDLFSRKYITVKKHARMNVLIKIKRRTQINMTRQITET